MISFKSVGTERLFGSILANCDPHIFSSSSSSSTGIMWLDPLPSTYMRQLSHSCSFLSSIGSILLLLQFNVFASNWIIHSSYLFHVHFYTSFINHLPRFVCSMNGLCAFVFLSLPYTLCPSCCMKDGPVYAKTVYMAQFDQIIESNVLITGKIQWR